MRDTCSASQATEYQIIGLHVGLVLLDSVAALVRTGYGHQQLVERQEMLGLQAAALKYLAQTFSIPVVVTNQVRKMTRASHLETGSWMGSGRCNQYFLRTCNSIGNLCLAFVTCMEDMCIFIG